LDYKQKQQERKEEKRLTQTRRIYMTEKENSEHFERRQFTVFTSSSMMTFELMPGRWDSKKNKQTKPGLLLSMCPAKGKQEYSWEERQVFAFNLTEIGDMMAFLRGRLSTDKLSFYHKPGGDRQSKDQKIFALSPVSGGSGPSAYWVNLTIQKDSIQTPLKGSFTHGQVQVLVALLQQAAVELCNWKI